MGKTLRKAARREPEVGPGTKVPTTAAAAQVATQGAPVDLRRIKVVAIRTGYYQHKRRREGDVFFLVPLRTVKRATQEDCDADKTGKLLIGMVLKDPKTKREIPTIKTAIEQFSDKWMELADDSARPSITGLPSAMKKEHDRILLEKNPGLADLESEEEEIDGAADSGEGFDDNVVDQNKEVV